MTTFDRSVDGGGRLVPGRVHAAVTEIRTLAARWRASEYATVGGSRRYRAAQRRQTRVAARAGFVVIAAAIGIDSLNLLTMGATDTSAALAMNGALLGLALGGWWLVPRQLRKVPDAAAWLVAYAAVVSTVVTGLTVPTLMLQTAAYLVLLPSLVALVLPWSTAQHLRWMVAFTVTVAVYVVAMPESHLASASRWDVATVVLIGLGASLVGHVLLQRAQIRSFAQVTEIRALHRQADKAMVELERTHRALEATSRIDPLTGAGNRRRLDEDLRAVRGHIVRSGMVYGLLELDLDRFKGINDTFGHLAGDDVLRRVVEAIQGTLRTTDAIYRYGGDEFVVILPVPGREALTAAAERLRKVVLDLVIEHPANTDIGIVSVSIGATMIGAFNVQKSDDGWFALTDDALYEAKRSGRNQVHQVIEIA